MKLRLCLLVGWLPLLGSLTAAELRSQANASDDAQGHIRVIRATDSLFKRAADGEGTLRKLLEAAKPTIGVPYQWGGTRLEKGIDCSNYTWQLYQSIGMPYDRFLSTMAMSRLKRSNGLRQVAFEHAEAGDLLVYGYRDENGRWRGHVVILIDKRGAATGHEGLVLGAHGAGIGEVQFVTFTGFDDGYFREPQMRLCNVLRVEGPAGERRGD